MTLNHATEFAVAEASVCRSRLRVPVEQVYPDQTAGGRRHHWDTCSFSAAGTPEIPLPGKAGHVYQQYASGWSAIDRLHS